MTTPTPIPDQRRKYLLMLVVAAVLAALYMVYLAKVDRSLPLPSRRVGGSPVITYQRNPTAYLFGFLPITLGMFLGVVIVSAVFEGVSILLRGNDAQTIYKTRHRSQTPLRIVAAVLSLIIPGLGHAFAGRFARSAMWVFCFLMCMLASLWMFLHVPSIGGLIFPLLVIVGLRIAVAVDAFGEDREVVSVSWGKRIGGLFGFIILYVIASTGVEIGRVKFFGESFLLPSGSMEPTLMMGDYVMTTPLSGETVKRNQIVMFRWSDNDINRKFSRSTGAPTASTSRFVSRVVGVHGDTLSMRAGRLFRNGQEVVEPYAVRETDAAGTADTEFAWQKNFLSDSAMAATYRPSRNDWGPLVVVPNSVFVLGDNRDNSLDSRHRGLVSTADISLTPARIYYSRDPDTGRMRWNRIGKIVQSERVVTAQK